MQAHLRRLTQSILFLTLRNGRKGACFLVDRNDPPQTLQQKRSREREQRAAEALRANLRRRKQQQQQREQQTELPEENDPASTVTSA
jgi:hypothetical protein